MMGESGTGKGVYLQIYFGIILIFFLSSCGGNDGTTSPFSKFSTPVAEFSASPTTGNAPLTVAFSDQSTGGSVTLWFWDFGDGGTSTEQDPSHDYVTAGTYTVLLTVTGPNGSDTITKTNYIDVATSGIVSDDFSGATLDTGVWTFENPLGDGSVAMTGTQAAISVPAGTDHDVWTNGNLAPRLMQVAVDADFEVEVKFDSLPSQQYQMQGIFVEQDDLNFLRFDFFSDGSGLRLFAASFTGGSPSAKANNAIGGGTPLYMRVKRTGDQWTQSYSYDGITWVTNVTFTHALTVTVVGPFASNAESSTDPAPAYTGLVDYFFNTAR